MFLDLFQKNALYKYTIKKKKISVTLLSNLQEHIFTNTTNIMNIYKVSIEDDNIYKD
jgi:hypothetical protein